VDCAGISTTDDMSVVMAWLFGHVDGEKQMARILVLVALRQRQLPDLVRRPSLVTAGGLRCEHGVKNFLGESSSFDGNGSGVCGCRNPLGRVGPRLC
jgi:hypothetical protein